MRSGRRVDHRSLPATPEQYLVAAIIAQGIADARAGDRRAAQWLETDAVALLEAWLNLDPSVLARWSEVPATTCDDESEWSVEWGLEQVS